RDRDLMPWDGMARRVTAHEGRKTPSAQLEFDILVSKPGEPGVATCYGVRRRACRAERAIWRSPEVRVGRKGQRNREDDHHQHERNHNQFAHHRTPLFCFVTPHSYTAA